MKSRSFIRVRPPISRVSFFSSRMVLPVRVASRARRAVFSCLGASWPLAASARSMRAFCLVVRALGWRRSHSSSVRRKFCRLPSVRASVGEALGLGLEVIFVAAVVGVERALVELERARDHVVEQRAVVGDEQEGAGVVFGEVALEPLDRLDVEVVRGLVEDGQRGARDEDAGQRRPAALAAGEGADGLVGAEDADVAEDGLDLVHHVPAAEPLDVGGGLLLLLDQGRQVAVVPGQAGAGPLVAGLGVGPGGEPALDDEAGGELGGEGRVLVEVGDVGAAAPGDRPGVGRLDAAEDAGERALARPVVADQAHALSGAEGERHAPEDLLRAVRFLEILRCEDQEHAAELSAGAPTSSADEGQTRIECPLAWPASFPPPPFSPPRRLRRPALPLVACAAAPPPAASPEAPPPPGFYAAGPREPSPVDHEMVAIGHAEEEIDRLFPEGANAPDGPLWAGAPGKAAPRSPYHARQAHLGLTARTAATERSRARPLPGGASRAIAARSPARRWRRWSPAAERLCQLSGENDGRCDDARARVRGAGAARSGRPARECTVSTAPTR